MIRIQRSAMLLYSAQQMFDLVNDVEAYPQFVPYCSDCTLIAQSEHSIEARLDLTKGALRQALTTRNQLSVGNAQQPFVVKMQLVEGPFTAFSGIWTFDILEEHASRVSLDITFDLQAGLLRFAMKQLFENVTGRLVDAFAARAKFIYG